MNSIEEIFNVEPELWIESLEPYQYSMIEKLYSSLGNYDDVAKAWLSASLQDNVPFGTEKKNSIFYEKVLDEIELFFSDDDKYKNNRLALLKESGVVQNYIVGAISIALAPVLGTSAPFLAPVISIILCTIGKIGLNAWLETRKEKRKQNNQ